MKKEHFQNWLAIVLCSNALALPVWFRGGDPWWPRVAGLLGFNFVLLPLALWLGELRKRRAQRNEDEWNALNRALDLAAPDSVAQYGEGEESANSRAAHQQIRKRNRYAKAADRTNVTGPPSDPTGGGVGNDYG